MAPPEEAAVAKKKRAEPSPEVEAREWIRTAPRSHPGVKCTICTNARAKAVVHEIAQAIRAGEDVAPYTELAKYLTAKYGVRPGAHIVQNHMLNHEQVKR
jgi:hypothetical protein